MAHPSVVRAVSAVVACAAFTLPGIAQWSTDPASNTPIDVSADGQDLCKVAATPDGGCWVAWFSSVPSPTFYEVRIQRLDRAGNAAFGPAGMLVSDNPSASFTAGEWDLRSDSEGNALLVFNDLRGGADREISAYRIAPDGTMLWGANGVQLSDNTVDEFDSRIVQTSDGLFTVVFGRNNSGTTPPRGLIMQRLDAAGNKLLGPDGVLIYGSGVGGAAAADGPGFFQMVAADNNSVIVFFGKDTRTFSSLRVPTIQKFDATGAGLWNDGNAIILWTNVWPIGYYPNMISDGEGGAIVSWHDNRRGGSTFDAWVQHVDAGGTQRFPFGGAAVSVNNTGRLHASPSAPVRAASGDIYVFWSERDGSQGMRALAAQKFNSVGARQWGDGGIELTAFDTTVEDFFRVAPVPCESGAIVAFKTEPQTGTQNDTIEAIRVDENGLSQWLSTVSSVASDKGRMPSTVLTDGSLVIAWSDTRSDAGDIYIQKLNPDGTLGGPTLCPGDFNRSGEVSVQDIFDFLAAYFSNDPCADVNASGGLSVQDIFDFLAVYFAPCV